MQFLSLLLLMFVAAAPTPRATAADVPSADTIYFGGDIITVNERQPAAEALAVRDGKIAAVGNKDEVFKLRGDGTRMVDLAGKALVPGFVDPHSHFMNALQVIHWANLAGPPVGPVTDIASLVEQLREIKKQTQPAPGEWIVGYGYDPDTLKEKRQITRDDLDPFFPDNPVMVLHVSLHGCVLNSRAFEKVGINADTPTPEGGVIVRKPGSNEPAGLLMENAFLPIVRNLPKLNEEQFIANLKATQLEYAKNGYTTVQEGATSVGDIRLLKKAAAQGLLFLDIVSLPLFTEVDQVVGKPEFTFGKYDGRFKLQGVKNLSDGSPQGKTAYWTKPMLVPGPGGQQPWRGQSNMTQTQVTEIFRRCYEHDVQVFTHANGDAAIDMVIAAHEATTGDNAARRPVVVHSQFVRPDQLEAYVRLKMIPSFFTNHAYFWGDVHVQNLGYARASQLSPAKSAEQLGLRFTNHTDYVVTPLDPLFTMWSATNRISRSGVVIGPNERISPLSALRAITLNSAYQHFEEDAKGSLEVGKLADLVILDRSPLMGDVTNLRDVRVVETIKQGQTVFPAR